MLPMRMFAAVVVVVVVGLMLTAGCSSGETGTPSDPAGAEASAGESSGATEGVAAVTGTLEPSPTATPVPTSTATPTVTPTPLPTVVPAVDLVGRVQSPEGLGLSAATIRLGDRRVMTDEDGQFVVPASYAGEVVIDRPAWIGTTVDWDGTAAPIEVELDPLIVRALRVSAYSEVTPERFDQLLDLAEGSSVNALVFDTKDESGAVRYETSVQEAYDLGAVKPAFDPELLIARSREAGLYTITRIVSFEDPIRTNADPSTRASRAWVDVHNPDNWQYLFDLAVEACELGFDEIQLDYVRFPTGEPGYARPASQEERVNSVVEYVRGVRDLLHPLGCALSADIFGIVLNSPDDQGIGQTPEDLSHVVDALSPMVYPSHYSSGWLGLASPNAFPYEVVADALDDGIPRLEGPAIMRPWLQAFWYSPDQILRGIQASEDRDVGWILWEAGGSFSAASLPAPISDAADPSGTEPEEPADAAPATDEEVEPEDSDPEGTG